MNGLPVRPGRCWRQRQSEAAFVVDAGWEGMTFMVSPQVIGEHLAIRQRDPEFHRPQGVEALQVSEARAQQLFDWGRRLVDAAVHDPALLNDSEAERGAAQVELIETLLAALDRAKDLEPSRGDRTRQAQSLIVKTAEAHAVSKAGASLYVTDLCKAAGVSERTLEYAFKEVMGLTPVAYLVRLRLHRVRQALLAAPLAPPRSRRKRSTGASGTSVISRGPTRNVSANCRRIPCGGILWRRDCCRFSAPGQTHRRNRYESAPASSKSLWSGVDALTAPTND
ncbi:MAG: helix-turn-helix domain-containing protein [Comamonadaceae bacterium]|nr:helix-turn-helix domain-containing protein [Comamonadaceae bacterium]